MTTSAQSTQFIVKKNICIMKGVEINFGPHKGESK